MSGKLFFGEGRELVVHWRALHAKHAHESARSFGLLDVEEVGDKANWVAASGGLVSQRKVGPAPVRQIYPERTEVAIAATRIKRDVFVALAPAVG